MAAPSIIDQVKIYGYFDLDVNCLLYYDTQVYSDTPVLLDTLVPYDGPVPMAALCFVMAAVALVLCIYYYFFLSYSLPLYFWNAIKSV